MQAARRDPEKRRDESALNQEAHALYGVMADLQGRFLRADPELMGRITPVGVRLSEAIRPTANHPGANRTTTIEGGACRAGRSAGGGLVC